MHKLNTAERKRTKKDYSEWRALVISIRKPSNPRMCEGCLHSKICVRCLNTKTRAAIAREARLLNRNAAKEAAAEAAAVEEPKQTSEPDAVDDVEDEEELFDEWAPDRVQATPERPSPQLLLARRFGRLRTTTKGRRTRESKTVCMRGRQSARALRPSPPLASTEHAPLACGLYWYLSYYYVHCPFRNGDWN